VSTDQFSCLLSEFCIEIQPLLFRTVSNWRRETLLFFLPKHRVGSLNKRRGPVPWPCHSGLMNTSSISRAGLFLQLRQQADKVHIRYTLICLRDHNTAEIIIKHQSQSSLFQILIADKIRFNEKKKVRWATRSSISGCCTGADRNTLHINYQISYDNTRNPFNWRIIIIREYLLSEWKLYPSSRNRY